MGNKNTFPYFGMDGVNEDEAFEIDGGEEIVKSLINMAERGTFEGFDFGLLDTETPVTLRCHGYGCVNRYGLKRLYISYMHVGDGDTNMYLAYIVYNDNGAAMLVLEHDENMMSVVRDAFNASYLADQANAEAAVAAQPTKSKSKACKVIFIIGCVLLFPVWLLWQFIKALLSLFNIGFGDSTAVRAFKRGFNGTEDRKAYMFTNDMGCEETVYSDDGRTFYHADGSYAGESDDNGKTIHQ